MIDKTLNDLHFKAGLWNSKGELSPSTHASNDPCVEEALTTIYEIGLECIGADLPMDSSDRRGNPKYSLKNLVINEKLASQRKAWAKACGVENKL